MAGAADPARASSRDRSRGTGFLMRCSTGPSRRRPAFYRIHFTGRICYKRGSGTAALQTVTVFDWPLTGAPVQREDGVKPGV